MKTLLSAVEFICVWAFVLACFFVLRALFDEGLPAAVHQVAANIGYAGCFIWLLMAIAGLAVARYQFSRAAASAAPDQQ